MKLAGPATAAIALMALTPAHALFLRGGGAVSAPPPPPTTNASLINIDTAPSGFWVGNYGSEGYIVAPTTSLSTSLPSYATVTNTGTNACGGTGPNSAWLEFPNSTPATDWCWIGNGSFDITLNITDSKQHKVTLYAADPFNGTPLYTVSAINADTSAPLQTQYLSNFFGGNYQSWNVSGHVTFHMSGNWSGIFFDPVGPLITPSYVLTQASASTLSMGIPAPTDPRTPLSVTVTALPTGGTITLADGITPVTVSEVLTVAQLTSLKLTPGAPAATTSDSFTFNVTNADGHGTAAAVPIIVENIPSPTLSQPVCTAANMEQAAVTVNNSGTPISVLVPRTAIQPSEVAIIVNDLQQNSIILGHYLQDAYGLAGTNIIHVSIPVADLGPIGVNSEYPTGLITTLKSQIDTAAGAGIQAYILAWTKPSILDDGVHGITFPLTGLPDSTTSSPYYDSATTVPFTDLGIRPVTILESASLSDEISLITKGAGTRQTTQPSGHIYYTVDDAVRGLRGSQFNVSTTGWNSHSPSLAADFFCTLGPGTCDSWPTDGNGPVPLSGISGILVYEMGATGGFPLPDGNTFVPGALYDNLTSFGGAVSEQYKVTQSGISASYGTVSEPLAIGSKFPDPVILSKRYFSGETAGESYWKSVLWPYQGNVIGPGFVARPFGTTVTESSGTFTLKTSILTPGTTYRLQAASSCGGSYADLVTGISIPSGWPIYKTVTFSDTPASHPYYRLVTP